jgi:hypothetical protein
VVQILDERRPGVGSERLRLLRAENTRPFEGVFIGDQVAAVGGGPQSRRQRAEFRIDSDLQELLGRLEAERSIPVHRLTLGPGHQERDARWGVVLGHVGTFGSALWFVAAEYRYEPPRLARALVESVAHALHSDAVVLERTIL